MKILLWILAISITALAILQRSFRGIAFRQLGDSLGLKYSADVLPPDLDMTKASFFAPWDAVSNVVFGDLDNRQTALFDFHANHGDVGYKQTIVALKSAASIMHTSTLWKASDLKWQNIGDWIIIYRERQELAVKAIPDFLELCKQSIDYFESRH